MDERFNKLYTLKIGEGEVPKLQRICEDYHIKDNGIFDYAASFHKVWGLGPNGLIYLSYGMAPKVFDFNSLKELENYLDTFIEKN